MLNKFGRRFELRIQFPVGLDGVKPADILIENPFTIEFDIQRSLLGAPKFCTLRVMNLNQNTRERIRKDWDSRITADTNVIVQLKAGYRDVVPIVLVGDLTAAYSVREGNTFVTTIETIDGGFLYQDGRFNGNFPEGTPNRTVISSIAESSGQYGVDIGAIGNYPGTLARGNSYSGAAIDILRELTGGGTFIDNGFINCLNDNEFIAGDTLIINAANGLLNTPRREYKLITFDILFEPRVFIGQQVRIISSTGDADINGTYRVNEIHHKGMISDAVCGSATTHLTCITGEGLPITLESA